MSTSPDFDVLPSLIFHSRTCGTFAPDAEVLVSRSGGTSPAFMAITVSLFSELCGEAGNMRICDQQLSNLSTRRRPRRRLFVHYRAQRASVSNDLVACLLNHTRLRKIASIMNTNCALTGGCIARGRAARK